MFFLILACLAACDRTDGQKELYEFHAQDVTYESRGVHVPATFVLPRAQGDIPLVLMAHGHGGTRDEAGGFERLAAALARRGIASLRMDFAGCGESSEPFLENRLDSMIADLRAGLEFARSQPGIDATRAAIVGYSMGARIAMLSLADGYAAAVLWAPVGTNGPDAIFGLFGGGERYRDLRDEAFGRGSANFITPWGQEQELSRYWFEDMELSKPLEAIGAYPGSLLVMQGDSDPIIPSAVPDTVASAARSSEDVRVELLADADHGLGLYTGDPGVSDRVIAVSAEFIISKLMQGE